jgi:hypothetical protein
MDSCNLGLRDRCIGPKPKVFSLVKAVRSLAEKTFSDGSAKLSHRLQLFRSCAIAGC